MSGEAGGKGHIQRPRSIADEEWASRWDAIFGNNNKDELVNLATTFKETQDVGRREVLGSNQGEVGRERTDLA